MQDAPAVTPRWTVVVDGDHDGALNMALDHVLALSLAEGGGVLRFYGWERPTLSFGRNEPVRDRWSPAALADEGIDVVRRPTGGRAVLHHAELTYAVAVAPAALGGARAAYAAINRGLAAGLVQLGVAAQVAGGEGGRAPGPDAGACFRHPVAGEVTVDGRKLVGSAQARIGGAILQHGSILLHDDQRRLEGGAVTLAELLGGDVPPRDRLVAALLTGMAGSIPGLAGAREVFGRPGADPALVARWLAHYRSPDWTLRR